MLKAIGSDDLGDALQQAGVGIWYYDVESDTIQFDKSLQAARGLEDSAPICRRKAVERFVHPENIQITKSRTSRYLAMRRPFETRHRLWHWNGHFIPCVTNVTPILDSNGAVVKTIGVVKTLTQLSESLRYIEKAEMLAKLGRWHVELPSRKMTWSDGLFRIFGFEPGEVTPTHELTRRLYIESDREMIRNAIETAIASKTEFRFQSQAIHTSGEIRHLRVLGEIERNPDGAAVAYFGTVQDCTEEIRLDQEIRHVQKQEALGNLVAGISHDFNNILAIGLGNAELLKLPLSDAERTESIKEIIGAIDKGATLARQLLAFGKKTVLCPSPLTTDRVLDEFQRMARRVIPENIEFAASAAEDVWPVNADRNQLESALLNLSINARDAMPDGGKLRIRAENASRDKNDPALRNHGVAAGRFVQISVEDDGEGIRPGILEKVYDPFFTTKDVGKGSGLGLSMVKGFAAQSGGWVEISSDGEKGTTVMLNLPAAKSDANRDDAKDHKHVAKPETYVLVVEDEHGLRQLLRRQLLAKGHRVTCASNGDEAIALLKGGVEPDVVLTDMVMPGDAQGDDVARAANDLFPKTQIVFMSGYPNKDDLKLSDFGENTQFLLKPVPIGKILQAIQWDAVDA